MNFLQTRSLSTTQKEDILILWNSVSPANIAHNTMESLESYFSTLEDVVYTLTLDEHDRIVGWFADFNRDNGRWFAMLLDESIHGKGVGSQLLTQVKSRYNEISGWVIDHSNDARLDGNPYISPINFYLKNGFEIISDIRLELGHLSCVKMMWSKNK
jgi:GNAT superfamily N-acetyltransferase